MAASLAPHARTTHTTRRPLLPAAFLALGTFAIGTNAALKAPSAHVVGTDVSLLALAVAARNRARHGARLGLVAADLLSPFGSVDVVLANLPASR